MNKIGILAAIAISLLVGFGAGRLYSDYIKVNTAVKESLERRTVEYLKQKGYSPDQYTMTTIKAVKFDGMNDYSVDVQFKDEASRHYYYSEDPEGNIQQYGFNGTKHIESESHAKGEMDDVDDRGFG
ncbi:hypothetical protein RJP21_23125 [Paenibacillus sp. VCA1]|uniref:hypothetical protein n=1 Tax=Paenibacillus sp. VCA1 TaxID=3039148 RepID=UPI0028727D05|nr:hypothetical protein [Paenibacillus sp. VCA1]MDR9856500.1 hypothetical protein [Paenibacillus sp. VCA1]